MTKLNSNPTQNMERDDFEQRLREQPLRELPLEWRNRILSAAQAASQANEKHPTGDTPLLRVRLAALLWPAPKAWAGLAFIWLLLTIANQATLNPARITASTGSQHAHAAIAAWKEEERILAELIQSAQATVPEVPRRIAPQPRSEVSGPYRTI